MNYHKLSKEELISEIEDLQKKYDFLKTSYQIDVTEHKHTEKILHENEEKFRIIFESANVGKSMTYPNGEINVNKAFCEMLGYSKKELEDKKWQDITPSEDVSAVQNILDMMLKGKKDSVRFNKRYVHKNGSYLWCDVSVALHRDAGMKPLFFIATVIEITKQMVNEKALAASEEKFRNLVETTSDIIWETDANSRYTYVSPQVKKVLGYSPEELIGNPPFEFMPIDEAVRIRKISVEIVAFKKPFNSLVSANLHKDGHLVMLETSGVPVLDENNNLLGYRGIDRDVTERINAEDLLAKEKEKFEKIVETSPGAIFSFRMRSEGYTDFPYASPTVKDVYGFSPQEIKSDRSLLLKHVHPDDLKHVKDSLMKSAQSLSVWKTSFRYNHPEKGLVWLENSFMPEREPDGSIIWYGTITDITEHKLAEGRIMKNLAEQKLISEVAEKLVIMEDVNEINSYIGETIFSLVPGAYIFISTYNPERKSVKITHAFGFSRYVKTITDKLGLDPFGLEVKISEMSEDELVLYKSHALREVPGGLYALSARKIKKTICGSIEKILGVRKIITMGFSWQDRLFGGVTILMKNGEKPENAALIETIINQAAIKVQRRMSQVALRESEENYRQLYENAPVGLYRTTPGGKILRANVVLIKMLGYSTFEELSSVNLGSGNFIDYSNRKNFVAQIKIYGKVKDMESHWTSHDGNVLVVKESAEAICGLKGEILYIDGTVEDITERKKAEEEKNKAHEKYKEIFDASNDIIYTMDFQGNFTSVSPSAEKILGYNFETLSSRNMTNFISAEMAKIAFDNIEKKLRGEQIQTMYEIGFRNNFGGITDLEINSIIRYKDGRPMEVFGIARDITEKKKMVNDLQKNNDVQKVLNTVLKESLEEFTLDEILYRALESVVSIPWLALDKKGAIFLTNENGSLDMKVNYGLGEEVIETCKIVPSGKCVCGKALLEKKLIYLPEISHLHDVTYEGIKNHGHYCIPIMDAENVYGVINTYISKGHAYSIFETSFLTSVANTLAGIITRRKAESDLKLLLNTLELRVEQRTKELVRSEELYSTTVNSISDWIYVFDRDYKLVFLNDALKFFFSEHGEKTEMKGMNLKDKFGFLDAEAYMNFQKVFTEGIQIVNESEYTVFGKKYFTQRKISPVVQKNKVIRIVVTVVDITRQKEIENEILKNLEKEKELNMLRSQFLSTVSHEFRTPLAGILSSVQLLKRYEKGVKNENKEKMFRQISEAVNHTKTLLDDISLIDNEQSSKITMKPAWVNLNNLLGDIAEENIQVYGCDFMIGKKFNLHGVKYYMDREIIRHILGNILSNAIKYSGSSKEIMFTAVEKNKKITFEVTDHGIGIPAEEQKFLFEPFYRASNTENIQGTGFGLTVVKRFVSMCSGEIKIVSEKNKGTTVTVVLPVDEKGGGFNN